MDSDQSENKPKDESGALPQQVFSGVLSSDPDDATAVAGNQQSGGPSTDSSSGAATNSAVANPETTIADSSNQGDSEEKDEEKKPSAIPNDQDAAKTNSSSFAQLVKSWESYIIDAQNVDTFQPMQMFQNLRLCGAGHAYEMPRLTLAPSTDFTNTTEGQDPFEPIILRHTHSSPLQYRPSTFNDYENGGMPPPAELNPTRRSSSTPSRGSAFQQFNARSAWGAHMHSSSNLSAAGGRSAFGFPLHRSTYSGVSTASNSAFNPVPSSLSTTHEEPPQEENTSIEVMDLGSEKTNAEISKNDVADETQKDDDDEEEEVEVQIEAAETDIDQAKPKKSAAARAARFLSDVGVWGSRKKKGARSSIMTTISVDAGKKTADTKQEGESEEIKRQESDSEDRDKVEDFAQPSTQMYQQLDDSDVDEEFDRYQSIENTARDSDDSPRYHPIEDDRVIGEKTELGRPAVRIQVSNNIPVMPQIATTSPNPDHIDEDDDHSGTPTSGTNSPGGATRSSATTTTSGHTTQATSTTSTTGNNSQRSQISETDREVMETIKEGKRRMRQEINPASDKSDDGVNVTSDSSSSTTTTGYMLMSGSPGPLRDGANVVADRFFKNSQYPIHGGYPTCGNSVSAVVRGSGPIPNRARTLSLFGKSNSSNGSPSSLNSTEETPLTFVSYLDRQAASDLTSLRAATEVSVCRGDVEEREDSPAQIVGFPAALMGIDAGNDGQENAMSSYLYNMLDKFRSRPPRNSPARGLRTPTTPPPRLASPAYQHHQLSPPRKIVDHRVGSNVSRPYVVRTNPSTQKVVLVSPGSYVRPTTPLVCIPVGSPNYSPNQNRHRPLPTWHEQQSPYGSSLISRTYEEHNIEILKTDSKDEMIGQR